MVRTAAVVVEVGVVFARGSASVTGLWKADLEKSPPFGFCAERADYEGLTFITWLVGGDQAFSSHFNNLEEYFDLLRISGRDPRPIIHTDNTQ